MDPAHAKKAVAQLLSYTHGLAQPEFVAATKPTSPAKRLSGIDVVVSLLKGDNQQAAGNAALCVRHIAVTDTASHPRFRGSFCC